MPIKLRHTKHQGESPVVLSESDNKYQQVIVTLQRKAAAFVNTIKQLKSELRTCQYSLKNKERELQAERQKTRQLETEIRSLTVKLKQDSFGGS